MSTPSPSTSTLLLDSGSRPPHFTKSSAGGRYTNGHRLPHPRVSRGTRKGQVSLLPSFLSCRLGSSQHPTASFGDPVTCLRHVSSKINWINNLFPESSHPELKPGPAPAVNSRGRSCSTACGPRSPRQRVGTGEARRLQGYLTKAVCAPPTSVTEAEVRLNDIPRIQPCQSS